jgi:hypothetical protein
MDLDIRELKTYVISLIDSPHRDRISNMLNDLGFKDWEFFDAMRSTPHFSYMVGCSMSHRECFTHASLPCLTFEDDVDITEWYNPIVEIPDDSDLFYLGTSAWGMKTGNSTLNGSEFNRVKDNLYKVQNMTSGHAIIYINKEACSKLSYDSIRYMTETGKCYDESYALETKNYNAYSFEKPMFYQKCERNEIFTRYPVNTIYRKA